MQRDFNFFFNLICLHMVQTSQSTKVQIKSLFSVLFPVYSLTSPSKARSDSETSFLKSQSCLKKKEKVIQMLTFSTHCHAPGPFHLINIPQEWQQELLDQCVGDKECPGPLDTKAGEDARPWGNFCLLCTWGSLMCL